MLWLGHTSHKELALEVRLLRGSRVLVPWRAAVLAVLGLCHRGWRRTQEEELCLEQGDIEEQGWLGGRQASALLELHMVKEEGK